VFWSTGNEMFERGNANGQRIARALAARIKALDPTRFVSAAVNGLGKPEDWPKLDPLFAAFDVAGYNYELARHTADHARVPARVMVATESYQNEAFANWRIVRDQPYVAGDFVWCALDYLGEAGIGRVYLPDEPAKKHWEGDMFPWHGAYSGDTDLTGWRKPVSYYRNLVWDRGEKLYAAVLAPTPDGRPWNVTPWSMPPALPGWTWLGAEGKPLTVEVYSRHEAVRLTLNGKVLGEKPTTEAEEFRATFTVPYAPGELRVSGLRGGKVVGSFVLKTATEPVALRLTTDRVKLRADGQDLAFVTVEALDKNGTWNPTATTAVNFTVTGAGTLAGAGTGDLTTMESYTAGAWHLFQGRALVVVRTTGQAGSITLTATAPGIATATAKLKSGQP
jgi:beta-galactosidase